MQINTLLYQIPTLHYAISKIIQRLLEPIKVQEYISISYQLKSTKLKVFKVDDYVLSIEIEFNTNDTKVLQCIGKAYCTANKFELLVCTREEKEHTVLCLDFIHHDLWFLIDIMKNEDFKRQITEKIIQYFNELTFYIVEKNQAEFYDKQYDNLLQWAIQNNIPQTVLPHTRNEIISLKKINLSNYNLDSIPKSITLLENLEEIYLATNNLNTFPLQLTKLKKLKKIWLQENSISYLPTEINNLILPQKVKTTF